MGDKNEKEKEKNVKRRRKKKERYKKKGQKTIASAIFIHFRFTILKIETLTIVGWTMVFNEI